MTGRKPDQTIMAREKTPLLSLRMKSCHRGPSCPGDSDCTLETLSVMTSQDAAYRCRDYLTRRAPPKSLEHSPGFVDEYDDFDDQVDMVCREKMCEWSYRVCDHFHTSREIVAIAFSYLDRFIDRCSCDRSAFKLAAMTAMYMATKVFNAKQISIFNLAELSRGEFDVSSISEMEKIILETLEWRMNPPTSQAFIVRLCRLIPVDVSALVNGIYERAIFFAELCVFDYSFVTEEKYLVAVACILNAIEGMEDASIYENLSEDFLEKLDSSMCVDLDRSKLERAQGRQWFLYGCSAQLQQDDIMPLHVRTEGKSKDAAHDWMSGASLSPVSVDRPL